ncbi:hypothetical protein D6779_09575 [Candidatus Parcubacteria bacterium]|nr:MAG: hypothetical protein D6779_09575 [Candidatus Parcubacteria bacterium]
MIRKGKEAAGKSRKDDFSCILAAGSTHDAIGFAEAAFGFPLQIDMLDLEKTADASFLSSYQDFPASGCHF